MDFLVVTLRGMATPRRAIPIALVCVPLALLEGTVGGARGVLLAITLFGSFLLFGPASYRKLFPVRDAAGAKLPRIVAFAALTAVYVGAVALVLPRLFAIRHSILTDSLSVYFAGPLFWAGSWALGRDLDWETSLEEAHARNEALVREAERAQLLALRTHLDPHFLFNTLNAIAEWCRADPVVAEHATLQLSSMLRTILAGVNAPAWELRSELELVRQLLELHHARDPERFSFAIEVTDEAGHVPVPPMLLLSLAENAIKHGPAAGHRGAIALSARLDAGWLQVELANPGPFLGARDGGQGLPIVEKRLKLAYDGSAHMRHESDGSRTTVVLRLPLSMSGAR